MEFPFHAQLTHLRGRDAVLVHEIRFDPVNPPKALVSTPDGENRVLVNIDRIRAV